MPNRCASPTEPAGDAGRSTTPGAPVVLEDRSFSSPAQRWALTHLPGGNWAISNLASGLCFDSATSSGAIATVQNTCALAKTTQQWTLTATSNGYATLTNQGTGLALDVTGGSASAGAALNQIAVSIPPAQSQQWLLRPVFFRGVDNALLEKQEADRLSANLPWWQDAGQTQDLLQILKNHGVNMVRIRPTSVPPYQTFTLNGTSAVPATCSGNGCYTETDDADLDLAKRAKQLGMAVELTLFFDGGSSSATPGAWSSDSLSQLETDVYNYVKAEVEAYRSAGVMPDMVTIGNEVDTGFFGSLASPGTSFSNFAAVEQKAMQAVLDASSDTTPGPAIPPPLRCIHVTPAWNLTSFFTEAKSNSIPFDAICQSYYPFYHGPLTSAQAAASNPNNQPVEQSVLTTTANSLGVPIFLIEVGEHYENGFDSNDPWYSATVAGQRQFLIDLNTVLKGLPENLGMGMEYWDPEGVNTTSTGGGFTSGDGRTDGTYLWNGLTLFDNADTSGISLSTATNYAAILSGADALGGKIDPTQAYALVNVATGQILGTAGLATESGTPLGTAPSDGGATMSQQWSITSNGDGYLQIANLGAAQGTAALVLDNSGITTAGSPVVLKDAAAGTASQEWNLVTAGNGDYTLVNKASGLLLAAAAGGVEQEAPSSTSIDWITPADKTQLWQIIPVHITEAATASQLSFASGTPSTATYGATLATVNVNVLDGSGSLVLTPSTGVTLQITGPNSYSDNLTASSTNGVASFDLSGATQLGSATLNASGVATYTCTLPPGTNSITVAYAGNADFAASTSTSVLVTEPDFALSANQDSLTLASSGNGSISLTLTPEASYQGTVTMSYSSTLAGLSCSFSPTTYAFNGSSTALSGTVTITSSSATAMLYPIPSQPRGSIVGISLCWLPAGALLLLGRLDRKRFGRHAVFRSLTLVLLLLLTTVAGFTACGGSGSGGSSGQQPVTGTVTITAVGSTGDVTQTAQIAVTVN
jgi:arabinogalactan endo-1,4-beta-galactosidase